MRAHLLTKDLNQNGVITYNKLIVDQLIRHALEPYKKKVYLAHYRGASSDLSVKIGNFDALAEKEIRMTTEGVFVRFYVIVRIGQSITEICRDIITRIATDIEEPLQLPVDNIEIVVTAVLAKNPAKRDLFMDYRSMVLHEAE